MQIGTAYFGSRMLRHVEHDMKELATQGFTHVLHTGSEFDFMFRQETLKTIIKLSREAGLTVWVNPWGIGKVFGGEPYSQFVCKHLFDACQILDDGRVIPAACPNAPAFLHYMQSWVDAILETRVHGILWDEPHFHEQGFLTSVPGRWGCRCSFCQTRFYEQFHYQMPTEETDDVITFKQNSLLSFLQTLLSQVKARECQNIVYLRNDTTLRSMRKHWEPLARLDTVDVVSTGPYWLLLEHSVNEVEKVSETLHQIATQFQKQAHIWIQCFRIPAGREDELETAVQGVIRSGVDHLAFWGYRGCEQESWVSCERPEIAWNTVLQMTRYLNRERVEHDSNDEQT
jgi:hypothetical protein